MPHNLKRHGQPCAGSAVATSTTSRRPPEGLINIGPALECSRVMTLSGRPYPVQFRNQGGIDAWTRALGNTEIWRRWQAPGTLCWQIRQELLRQLEPVPQPLVVGDISRKIADDRHKLAVEISTNLKYHLNKGTVIETTPALETLLTNSDVDLNLPMSMVALPYRAQYLRFGEVAMRYLKVPASQAADRFFDGVFCFLTPHDESGVPGGVRWTLELVFASKRQDCYSGHVSLLGETDRGSTTVGEWLTVVLDAIKGQPEVEFHRPMHAAVSYVVRVFLYMALKQARVMEHFEYDAALLRAAGLGERKRSKLLQRSASLYNGILSVLSPCLPPLRRVGLEVAWRRTGAGGTSGCRPSVPATCSANSFL